MSYMTGLNPVLGGKWQISLDVEDRVGRGSRPWKEISVVHENVVQAFRHLQANIESQSSPPEFEAVGHLMNCHMKPNLTLAFDSPDPLSPI